MPWGVEGGKFIHGSSLPQYEDGGVYESPIRELKTRIKRMATWTGKWQHGAGKRQHVCTKRIVAWIQREAGRSWRMISASMLKLLELEALEHSGQAKHKELGTKKG